MSLEDDYSGHKGFDPAFLGAGKADGRVFLPDLSPALAKQATPLSGSPKETVLKYRNFSIVMHRVRRFAIYSAANVDFKGRFELARPKDRWRFDPRIPAEMQVGESFYTGNAFDRGHRGSVADVDVTFVAAKVQAAEAADGANFEKIHVRGLFRFVGRECSVAGRFAFHDE